MKVFLVALTALAAAYACLVTGPVVSNITAGIFLALSYISFGAIKKPMSYILGVLMIIMFCFFFVKGNPMAGLLPERTAAAEAAVSGK